MKNRHWMIAGTALLLMSCQPNRPPQANVQPSPQVFAKPVIPQKTETVPPIKVPGMIPTTDNQTPLMPVAIDSTRDPFAAPTLSTDLQATVVPQKTNAQRGATFAKSSIGAQPIVQLPPVQYNPMPQTVSVRPLPAIPVAPPPMPPMSQTNLAEAIALTGVIQTGNQVSAIIEDADGTSRYVQVGEKLANGAVTVKRINLNAGGGDPSIVLVQNGVELVKTVGRSEGSIAQAF